MERDKTNTIHYNIHNICKVCVIVISAYWLFKRQCNPYGWVVHWVSFPLLFLFIKGMNVCLPWFKVRSPIILCMLFVFRSGSPKNKHKDKNKQKKRWEAHRITLTPFTWECFSFSVWQRCQLTVDVHPHPHCENTITHSSSAHVETHRERQLGPIGVTLSLSYIYIAISHPLSQARTHWECKWPQRVHVPSTIPMSHVVPPLIRIILKGFGGAWTV